MFTQRKHFELKKVSYKVTLYECHLPSEIVNMMNTNKASVFIIYIIKPFLKISREKHYALSRLTIWFVTILVTLSCGTKLQKCATDIEMLK